MDDIQSSFLRQFAQTDGFAGQFSLREKQPGENRLAFSIDDTGVISTDTERPIDFEKDQTQFELVVEYLHSDGVQKYVDNLTIDVTNNAIDDYDIDLAKIDLTTRQGANDSTQIVDNILKRLSLIQSDLGATKNRLFYNMNYQLHKSLNTQMANGRIMDADIAVEMSALLKQQLLQKAAYSMLNLITQAKLKQANILIPY